MLHGLRRGCRAPAFWPQPSYRCRGLRRAPHRLTDWPHGQAESAIESGRVDHALATFADAGRADPTRKRGPHRVTAVRPHQLRTRHRGGRRVLQRDPDDLVADGILTVSGSDRHRLTAAAPGRDALPSAPPAARRGCSQAPCAPWVRNLRRRGPRRHRAAAPPARRSQASAPAPARTAPAPAARPSGDAPASGNPFERIGGN